MRRQQKTLQEKIINVNIKDEARKIMMQNDGVSFLTYGVVSIIQNFTRSVSTLLRFLKVHHECYDKKLSLTWCDTIISQKEFNESLQTINDILCLIRCYTDYIITTIDEDVCQIYIPLRKKIFAYNNKHYSISEIKILAEYALKFEILKASVNLHMPALIKNVSLTNINVQCRKIILDIIRNSKRISEFNWDIFEKKEKEELKRICDKRANEYINQIRDEMEEKYD